jgi:hypothetical protein
MQHPQHAKVITYHPAAFDAYQRCDFALLFGSLQPGGICDESEIAVVPLNCPVNHIYLAQRQLEALLIAEPLIDLHGEEGCVHTALPQTGNVHMAFSQPFREVWRAPQEVRGGVYVRVDD